MTQYPNYEREQTINRRMATADMALRIIANYGDCLHHETPDEDEPVCMCPVCVAKRTLETETEWRYMGNHESRRNFNPREAAIADSWRRYFKGIGGPSPDKRLANILGFDEVNPRDWLVATTLVQWMVTNVGSALLYEAGYHYDPPHPPVPKEEEEPKP